VAIWRLTRRRAVRLSIEAGVALTVALGGLLLLRDYRIESLAARVASTRDWQTLHGITRYIWLRDGSFIYFRKTDANHLAAFRQRMLPAGHAQAAVSVNAFPAAPWQPFELSPDERWLTCWKPVPGRIGLALASLTDTNRKYVPFVAWSRCFWKPDSTALIGIAPSPTAGGAQRYHVVVHRIDGRPAEAVPLPPGMDDSRWSEGLQCVLPSGHLVVERDRDFNYGSMRLPASRTITFAEIDPRPRPVAPRIWSVPVPRDAVRGIVSVSPHGDRLLWMLVTNRPDPVADLLRRLMPRRTKQLPPVCWRVSRLDGTGMCEVGWYDDFDPRRYEETWIWPQWTADGSSLSFVKHDTLYLLPAH
jgi:hypothetical protein